MRAIYLITPFLAAYGIAQVATVTEYVTAPAASSPTASEQHKQVASTPAPGENSAAQTTFATSTLQSSAISSSANAAYATSDPSDGSGSSNGVDTDAGASGSGSSFSISKGGLIAIIVVVVIVAVFGIASTVLFVVAKRRQWNIRASIARASRRLATPLTPRFPRSAGPKPPPKTGSNRNTTMHAGRLASPGGDVRLDARGDRKGATRVEERDVEKGSNPFGKDSGWKQRLWSNDWK